MVEEFKNWLVSQNYAPSTINSYSSAIRHISRHYPINTGLDINICAVTDPASIKQIAFDYSRRGRFSDFGERGNATYRNAIGRYADFIAGRSENPLPKESNVANSSNEVESGHTNFAYERDLENALCAQIPELFPEYRIFRGSSIGVQYSIGGKRIDVLLENTDTKELLAVEIKSGTADCGVLGQIFMYIGLLQDEFPGKSISGVIVANTIDDGLRHACKVPGVTDKVTLKTYRMNINLENA